MRSFRHWLNTELRNAGGGGGVNLPKRKTPPSGIWEIPARFPGSARRGAWPFLRRQSLPLRRQGNPEGRGAWGADHSCGGRNPEGEGSFPLDPCLRRGGLREARKLFKGLRRQESKACPVLRYGDVLSQHNAALQTVILDSRFHGNDGKGDSFRLTPRVTQRSPLMGKRFWRLARPCARWYNAIRSSP